MGDKYIYTGDKYMYMGDEYIYTGDKYMWDKYTHIRDKYMYTRDKYMYTGTSTCSLGTNHLHRGQVQGKVQFLVQRSQSFSWEEQISYFLLGGAHFNLSWDEHI